MEELDYNKILEEVPDEYYTSSFNVERFMQEYQELTYKDYISVSRETLTECLEFEKSNDSDVAIATIQEHFAYMAFQALKTKMDIINDGYKVSAFEMEIMVNGDEEHKITDLNEVIEFVLYELPKVDKFKIVSRFYGPSLIPLFNSEISYHFYPVDEFFKKEKFTYAYISISDFDGSRSYGKIVNGERVDLPKCFASDIVNKENNGEWWTWDLAVVLDFDFDKHKDILSKLRSVVLKHLPEDEHRFCKDAWDDEEDGARLLIECASWYTGSLKDVQDLFDELSEIIEPIKKEEPNNNMILDGEGLFLCSEAPFGVAICNFENNKGTIIGVEM